MSLFTAGYDTKTDTIFGCKEYSKEWWHEKGHQLLHNTQFWKTIELYHGYLFMSIIVCLITNYRKIAAILMMIYLFVLIEDEFVAWIYCFKHKSEWIK